jgi:hydroxymethylglutaryl-CoA reductase (NADPH)
MPFSLRQVITVHLELNEEVSPEKRKIGICFSASPFGKLKFEVEDNVTSPTNR